MFIIVGHAIFEDSHQFFYEGINLVGTAETIDGACQLIRDTAEKHDEELVWDQLDTHRRVGIAGTEEYDDEDGMAGYLIWEV